MRYRTRFSKATKEEIRQRLYWLQKPAQKGVLSEYIATTILGAYRKRNAKGKYTPKPISVYRFLYALHIALYTEDDFLIAYVWVTLGAHLARKSLYYQVRKNQDLLERLTVCTEGKPRERHILELRRLLKEARRNTPVPPTPRAHAA